VRAAWMHRRADVMDHIPRDLIVRIVSNQTAARLVRGGRRRRLKIQATWLWAAAITAAWQRIDALPQAP
jgi:hypothetical protein